MNRLTRVTAILVKLQSKTTITAKEIASAYDISLRTVYRDIKTLQDAGVPIGSEAGVGYFMVDGYKLPPVSFSEEEANAMVTAEQFVLHNAEHSLVKNYQSALTKIKAVLKNSQREKIELLESRISQPFFKNQIKPSSFLSEIQKAITSFTVIEMEYHGIASDTISTRRVEPLGLYFTDNKWILIAHCLLRNDVRNFRLDRILALRPTQLTSSKAQSFSLEDFFAAQLEEYSKSC